MRNPRRHEGVHSESPVGRGEINMQRPFHIISVGSQLRQTWWFWVRKPCGAKAEQTCVDEEEVFSVLLSVAPSFEMDATVAPSSFHLADPGNGPIGSKMKKKILGHIDEPWKTSLFHITQGKGHEIDRLLFVCMF